MNTESGKSSKSNSIIPLVLFILNIIVITNTQKEVFHQLGHDSYYNYILFSLIYTYVVIGVSFLTWGGVIFLATSNTEQYNYPYKIQVLFFIMGCIIIGGNYYFMGKVWYDNPQYSLLFYNKFWSEGALPNLSLSNKWAYVMSDILIRIYSTIILLFTMIGIPVLCCVASVMGIRKKKEETPNITYFGTSSL